MSKSPCSADSASATALNDLPDVILSNIFALLTDTRSRNSLSLVCRKYCALERATRTSLVLRGNVKDLYRIPTGFRSVTSLDLSLLSPWGHDLLSAVSDPLLLADGLAHSFPLVESLAVYARSFSTLLVLLPRWPLLRHLRLVRWHQRPHAPLGADFTAIFAHCRSLLTLDVSNFYYYTEDLHPVLQEYPLSAGLLTKLDLLTVSFSEGFKSQEIKAITSACGNLKELLLVCTFDTRYNGYVGDEAMLDIALNCPKLSILHLVDTSSLLNLRGDPEVDGFTSEDAGISHATMVEFFSRLGLLEELVLDVCKNVRNSGMALEVLNSKCPKLKLLKLGQFHEMVMAIDSQLDGLARCHGLVSLSIKNSGNLTDEGLIEIARGCSQLVKFEIQGCKSVTWKGMRTLTCLLRRSLTDVSISCCKNLGATTSLRSVEPIRHRIQRLHIDCVWDGEEFADDGGSATFDLNEVSDARDSTQRHEEFMHCSGNTDYEDTGGRHKKCKYMVDVDAHGQDSHHQTNGNTNGILGGRWDQLRYLSLWISIGEVLAPLLELGLDDCPNLEEVRIKVEGDCRGMNRPPVPAFGLNNLVGYPALTKLQLDCGEVLGYALTAPSGQMDLTLWERFFLNGIADLSIDTLDYWPPQDRDVNQRSLSLPAVGLLSESQTLRKIFIHGTAHEHFMNFLLKIPSLRDAQLRADYYPAPENDMSTEMRVDSCSRFEDQLNRRIIPD